MNEGQFAAEFLAANVESIISIAKNAYQGIDEILKIKLKTAYKSYLSNTGLKYTKSKSFFIRDEAVDLYSYYVPVAIKNRRKTIEVPSAYSGQICHLFRFKLATESGSNLHRIPVNLAIKNSLNPQF